jgi:hypothetical protein
MAKVEFTAAISAIAGSMSGSVFQSTRSGHILRSKGFHSRSPTSNQLTAIGYAASRINHWRSLTIPQQQLWDAYALAHPKVTKFGKSTNLTGYQWFYSTNTILEILKEPTIDVPPVYVMPAALPSITPQNNAATIIIDFSVPLARPGEWLLVYVGHPTSPQTTITRHALRLIQVIDATAVVSIDVTASWQTYFNLSYPLIASTGSFVLPILITIADETSGVFPAGVSSIYDRT